MTLKTTILGAAGAAALLSPAGALAKDRDHDGLPDGWAHRHHAHGAKKDHDNDGLRNRGEWRHGTNPRRADTDRDGVKDGDEVKFGLRPRDGDSDDDGRRDGDEVVGTVESFTDGVLTLKLVNGDTLKGAVTDDTEIECEGPEDDSPAVTAKAASSGPGSDDDDDCDDRSGRRDGADDDSDDEDSRENPSDEHRFGEHRGDHDDHDHGRFGRECGTEALVPSARVHEAELKATTTGPVFEEVELARTAAH
jgi:hypothetical protein